MRIKMSKLNKIEGYCLQEIKNSKKFPLGTKEEFFKKQAKQQMAKDILKIIEENNRI